MTEPQYSNEQMNRMRVAMETSNDTPLQKLKTKFREEPLVPAGKCSSDYTGAALTTFALIAATYGVKKGNRQYTNNMFRLRVAAQSFTVLAMVGGSLYFQYKKNEEQKRLNQVEFEHANNAQTQSESNKRNED